MHLTPRLRQVASPRRTTLALTCALLLGCSGGDPLVIVETESDTAGSMTTTVTTSTATTTTSGTTTTTGSTTTTVTTTTNATETTGTTRAPTTDTTGSGDTSTSDPDTTTEPEAICGDDVIDPDEECDDGDANADDAACTHECVAALCGDGLVWAGEEECDDANDVGDDGCNPDCTAAAVVLQDLALGLTPACAVIGSGGLRCWGGNYDGQLGYGHTEPFGDMPGEMPTPFINAGGPVSRVAPGWISTCAVYDDGGVRCWGNNKVGQLGYGDTENRGDEPGEMPTPLVELGGGVAVDVSFGSSSRCALMEGGTVRCWGFNGWGKLGYESGDENECPIQFNSCQMLSACCLGDEPGEMPPPVVDTGGAVLSVQASQSHVCVLLEGGDVRCWGNGSDGRLGTGDTQHVGDEPGEMPPAIVNLGGVATQIALGTDSTYALVEGGVVRAWGRNLFGALGYGHTDAIGDEPGEMPPPAVNVGGAVEQIGAGEDFACARLEGGAVRCWGRNENGRLGLGHTQDIGDEPGEMPPPDLKLGGPAIELHVGTRSACVVLEGGAVRCWGTNYDGRLGYGHISSVGDEPGEMPPPDVPM